MNYIIQFTEIFKQTPPNTPLLLAFDPDYSVDKTNSIHMYTSQIYQKTKHKRHYSICRKFSSKHLPIPHCCLHLIQIIWSIKQISSISAVGEQRHKRPNVKNRFNFKKISDDVKCCMYCMYLGQPTK